MFGLFRLQISFFEFCLLQLFINLSSGMVNFLILVELKKQNILIEQALMQQIKVPNPNTQS